jgi:hypothetical protein
MDLDDTQCGSESCESDDDLQDFLGGDLEWFFQKMWHDKYGDITRDQLSRKICLEKTIKNDTTSYEDNLSWRVITLKDHFPVYCRGLVKGEYVVHRIHILGGVKPNLSGPHYIQIEDNPPFWVHSLTALRKKFFNYEDFVSFERSSFITFEFDVLTAIRVKMIRQIIRVDPMTPDEMIFITPNKMYSYNSHLVKPDIKNLSPRSSGQIERLIFNIRQIYYRDKQQMPTDDELFDLISKTHN